MIEKWKKRLYRKYQTDFPIDDAAWHNSYLARKSHLDGLIKDYIPGNRKAAILDLGCGQGHLICRLKELGYKRIGGVDFSRSQVQAAHRQGLSEIQFGDMGQYLNRHKKTFSVILMLDVLEHLEKQELFNILDKAVAALEPNGSLILHVPNAEGLFGMRIRYGDITHENCFTPSSIVQCLQACGFKRIQCFEDKPVVHGIVSFARRVIWTFSSLILRVVIAAETGSASKILSQNMVVVASRNGTQK